MKFPILYFTVRGASMEPSFKEGDKVWVNCLIYLFRNPTKGDIVVVKSPHENILVLKRVQKTEEGRYFIKGDNANQSTDSRHWGSVEKGDIIGKAIVRK